MQAQGWSASQVKICVINPEQKSQMGGANKFTVYTVQGEDNNGNIALLRRYSDFDLLREVLVHRWPGVYIPSLPSKKTIGTNDYLFVENRRKALETFLQYMAKKSFLWQSEQMQLFLRNTSGQSDKALALLMKEPLQHKLSRYQKLFGDYLREQVDSNANGQVTQFAVYLKEVTTMLQTLAIMAERIYTSLCKFTEKYLHLLEFLLPDYEKNCLLQYEQGKLDRLLFASAEQNGLADCLHRLKTASKIFPLIHIVEEIKREKRQVNAFLEAIAIKDELDACKHRAFGKVKEYQLLEVKINAGIESFLSKIKKKTKEQQMKENNELLAKAREQAKIYESICHITLILLSQNEIEHFKVSRQNAYYQLLRQYATAEKQMASIQREIWSCIGKHDLIGVEFTQGFNHKISAQRIESSHRQKESEESRQSQVPHSPLDKEEEESKQIQTSGQEHEDSHEVLNTEMNNLQAIEDDHNVL